MPSHEIGTEIIYHGRQESGDTIITVETVGGQQIGMLPQTVRHSPSGMNWGYRGSGPCARLSAFNSELAGWTQRYADHEWVTMTTGDGWRIGLQSAPDHVPPQWPDASHPQQAHLDLRVPDLAAGTQKAVELGRSLCGRTSAGIPSPAPPVIRSTCGDMVRS